MSVNTQRGFTLVELMVVVVIIGILAMVAYPSYQESITKTRRADGQGLALEILNSEERYYTQNNTYTADLTDLGYGAANNVDSDEGFYKATAAACGGTTIDVCVIITAAGQGAQAADGDLTINSRNVKTPSDKW